MTPKRVLECTIVDVNSWLGADVPRSRSVGIDELRASQRKYGIAHSLVRARAAVAVDRSRGNAEVQGLVGERGISVLATATRFHLSQLRGDLSAVLSRGGVGVWVEPGSWLSASIALDELFAVAASFGVPLLAPCRRDGEATVLGALAERHGVATVLVDARYPHFTDVLAAMERFDLLYIETSSLGSYRAIEMFVSRFGAARVLFGSGAPVGTPRSPLDAILWSRLSDEDRRAILGGNAMRLFALGELASGRIDSIFPECVFDVHAHFFPVPLELPETPGSFLADRPEMPIVSAVSSSLPAIMGDLERGNEEAIRIARDQPGQFVYLVVNPNDPHLAVDQLRRWGDDERVLGAKIHAEWSNLHTRSRRVAEVFEVLAPFRRPVLLHNVGDGWEDALIEIALRHPDLPIIIAHGGYHRPMPSSARVVALTPNVYVELASSKADFRDAAELVATVPAERLLFGSDAPLIEPSFVLGLYRDLELKDPAAVYRGNAERVFQRSIGVTAAR